MTGRRCDGGRRSGSGVPTCPQRPRPRPPPRPNCPRKSPAAHLAAGPAWLRCLAFHDCHAPPRSRWLVMRREKGAGNTGKWKSDVTGIRLLRGVPVALAYCASPCPFPVSVRVRWAFPFSRRFSSPLFPVRGSLHPNTGQVRVRHCAGCVDLVAPLLDVVAGRAELVAGLAELAEQASRRAGLQRRVLRACRTGFSWYGSASLS